MKQLQVGTFLLQEQRQAKFLLYVIEQEILVTPCTVLEGSKKQLKLRKNKKIKGKRVAESNKCDSVSFPGAFKSAGTMSRF